jgi:hypothetical protein
LLSKCDSWICRLACFNSLPQELARAETITTCVTDACQGAATTRTQFVALLQHLRQCTLFLIVIYSYMRNYVRTSESCDFASEVFLRNQALAWLLGSAGSKRNRARKSPPSATVVSEAIAGRAVRCRCRGCACARISARLPTRNKKRHLRGGAVEIEISERSNQLFPPKFMRNSAPHCAGPGSPSAPATDRSPTDASPRHSPRLDRATLPDARARLQPRSRAIKRPFS